MMKELRTGMVIAGIVLLGIVLQNHLFPQISCPAETSDAVLDAVYPKFYGEVQALNRMSGPKITKTSVAAEQHEIDCIGRWAEAHSTGCVLMEYHRWLAYYQSQLNEAKEEMATRSEQNNQTEYERTENARLARVARFEKQHPIPQPPKCIK